MTERNELDFDNPLAALAAEDAKRPGENPETSPELMKAFKTLLEPKLGENPVPPSAPATYRSFRKATVGFETPPRFGYTWFCEALTHVWDAKAAQVDWLDLEEFQRDVLASVRLSREQANRLLAESLGAFTGRGEAEQGNIEPEPATASEGPKGPGETPPTGAEHCDCAPTESAEGSLVAEASPNAVRLLFNPERFRGLDRIACGAPAAWDAALLANKLGPELLLGVSEYVTQLGLELRRRHVEHVAALLRAETEAWRAAGCPGKAPLVDREGAVTRRETRGAELARNVLAELENL